MRGSWENLQEHPGIIPALTPSRGDCHCHCPEESVDRKDKIGCAWGHQKEQLMTVPMNSSWMMHSFIDFWWLLHFLLGWVANWIHNPLQRLQRWHFRLATPVRGASKGQSLWERMISQEFSEVISSSEKAWLPWNPTAGISFTIHLAHRCGSIRINQLLSVENSSGRIFSY